MERKYQKKVKDWDSYHSDYVDKWNARLREAKENVVHIEQHPSFDTFAFDQYLRWFVPRTRVSLYPPAFDPEILEEHSTSSAEDLIAVEYNKLVREGHQTKFAPLINFMVKFYSSTFVNIIGVYMLY